MATETVNLHLGGNFQTKAEEQAAAAKKLADGLDKAGASASKYKAPKLSSGGEDIKKLEGQIASFNIGGIEKKKMLLQKQLDGMRSELRKSLDPPKANGSWLGGGSSELEGRVESAGSKFEGMGLSAGGALGAAAAGLAIVAGLAAKAASVVYDLGKAFTTIGIVETSKAEVQREIFAKLGGNYDADVKLAAKWGLGDDGIADARKLLKAKFSDAEMEVDFKIIAGIGAVEGAEKAKGYVEKLASQAAKGGKASEDTIKGFAEVGIKTDLAYAKLAEKLGISVEKAKQKVKAGSVDMKDALDAVRKAADQDFGGIAGSVANSVPVLLMRMKAGIAQLFSGFDLTPLKDALKNAAELLEGPEGALLKQSFSEAGSEIVKTLFGPFQGAEGKQRLISVMAEIVSMMRLVRDVAKEAAPAVKALIDTVASPAKGGLKDVTKGQKKSSELAGPGLINEGAGKLFGGPFNTAANDNMRNALNFEGLFGDTSEKAKPIGDAAVQGMADAINANPAAVEAMAQLAARVLQSARQGLDVQSPSKEMAKIGHQTAEGFGVGAEKNNAPAEAGKAIADAALGGASGASVGGGASGGAAAAAGGPVTINVVVPPGSSAETQAAAKRGAAEGLAEWQAYKRADARQRAA